MPGEAPVQSKKSPSPAQAPGPPLSHAPSPRVPATDFLQIFAQLWKQCVAGSSLPRAWHCPACGPGWAAAPHPAPQGSGVPAARPRWQYGAWGGARTPLSARSLWFPTPGGPSYLFSSLYEIHQPPRASGTSAPSRILEATWVHPPLQSLALAPPPMRTPDWSGGMMPVVLCLWAALALASTGGEYPGDPLGEGELWGGGPAELLGTQGATALAGTPASTAAPHGCLDPLRPPVSGIPVPHGTL